MCKGIAKLSNTDKVSYLHTMEKDSKDAEVQNHEICS